MKEEELKHELERTREDLKDLETYLNELNNFLPLAVCSVGPTGVVASVNSTFERMTGHSIHESIGRRIEEFFENQEEVKEFLTKPNDGAQLTKETHAVLLSKNFGKRFVNFTASARLDRGGELAGYFVGITDITELKELQNRLEEKVASQTDNLLRHTEELELSQRDIAHALSKIEEERNKTYALIMSLSDGLVYTDADGTIEIINPRAEAILKVSRTAALGTNIFSSDASVPLKKLSSMIAKNSVFQRETINFSDSFIIEASTILIKNERDDVVGRLIVLHDISKERALDNLKVEFISVAAHQMRTPLAAIKWAFELLLASDEDKLAPELKKIAENGFESTNRILAIVNNFLDVDAIESVGMDYVFAPVSITKVIEEVFVGFEIVAREKSIELIFENQGQTLPFIQADHKQIAIVFQNLIENALKYTMKSGAIVIRAEPRENDLLVSVTDQGIGIPLAEQKNVFSKFFRAENAKKAETDGNGLGLYTTKRIIERHGGSIWFDSKEGEGTTFYFTIPLYSR
jgi:PAS domain S-box-containing protein